MRSRLIEVLLLALAIGVPASLSASPPFYRGKLTGDISRLVNRQGKVHLSLQSPSLGNVKIVLFPFKFPSQAKRLVSDREDASLFQGEIISGGRDRRRTKLSADIIDGELTLRLERKLSLRSESRFFTIRTRVHGKVPSPAHVTRSPRMKELLCASGGSGDSAFPSFDSATVEAAKVYDPPKYIEVSTEADSTYFAKYKESSKARIQALLNSVDVLYATQLGLRIDLVKQHVFQTKDEPFVTNDAVDLILSFKNYTNRKQHLGSADVYHLFVARQTVGRIIGLAFVGQVCVPERQNYGLSLNVGDALHIVVVAHEIGHGLGATHPEDTINNPEASLMSAVVSADKDQFSEFSLNQIKSHLEAHGSCIEDRAAGTIDLSLQLEKTTEEQTLHMELLPSGDFSDCSVQLLGSAKRKELSDRALQFGPGSAEVLTTFEPTESGLAFSATSSAATRNGKNLVNFRASIECPNGKRRFSAIRTPSLKFKSRSKVNELLENLRAALQPAQ